MKHFSILLLLLLTASQYSRAQDIVFSDTISVWNEQKERQHLINREDSATWDKEMLKRDIDSNKSYESKPFPMGAFPVPDYNLLGKNTFKGVGVGSFYRSIENNNRHICCNFFAVRKNELIKQHIPQNKENEVFFTVVVLTDIEIDTLNYSHSRNQIVSRNNPDYIGQGYVKTKSGDIDYLAFLTADRNEYAVVNMRLFNLKQGRIILIAPQKDGSVRSLQLKSDDVLSMSDVENHIDHLLLQKKVKDFMTRKGNI